MDAHPDLVVVYPATLQALALEGHIVTRLVVIHPLKIVDLVVGGVEEEGSVGDGEPEAVVVRPEEGFEDHPVSGILNHDTEFLSVNDGLHANNWPFILSGDIAAPGVEPTEAMGLTETEPHLTMPGNSKRPAQGV